MKAIFKSKIELLKDCYWDLRKVHFDSGMHYTLHLNSESIFGRSNFLSSYSEYIISALTIE